MTARPSSPQRLSVTGQGQSAPGRPNHRPSPWPPAARSLPHLAARPRATLRPSATSSVVRVCGFACVLSRLLSALSDRAPIRALLHAPWPVMRGRPDRPSESDPPSAPPHPALAATSSRRPLSRSRQPSLRTASPANLSPRPRPRPSHGPLFLPTSLGPPVPCPPACHLQHFLSSPSPWLPVCIHLLLLRSHALLLSSDVPSHLCRRLSVLPGRYSTHTPSRSPSFQIPPPPLSPVHPHAHHIPRPLSPPRPSHPLLFHPNDPSYDPVPITSSNYYILPTSPRLPHQPYIRPRNCSRRMLPPARAVLHQEHFPAQYPPSASCGQTVRQERPLRRCITSRLFQLRTFTNAAVLRSASASALFSAHPPSHAVCVYTALQPRPDSDPGGRLSMEI